MKKSNTAVFPQSPHFSKDKRLDISDTTNIDDNKYLKYEKYVIVISRSLTSQSHLSKKYERYKIHYCVLSVPSHIFQKQDLDDICFENRSGGALVLCLRLYNSFIGSLLAVNSFQIDD